jgi:hypothetical protein
MQYETVSPDGVHLAGNFNDWNYTQTLMTNTAGTIYETTLMLDADSYNEFRYVNGNTAGQSETVPGACSINGNRMLVVSTNDTILNLVCFSSCDTCGPINGSAEFQIENPFLAQNYPNPCSEMTHIGYRINQDGFLTLSVYGMTGGLISVLSNGPCKPGVYDLQYQTNDLPSGIYYYQMVFTSGSKSYTESKKMIVE